VKFSSRNDYLKNTPMTLEDRKTFHEWEMSSEIVQLDAEKKETEIKRRAQTEKNYPVVSPCAGKTRFRRYSTAVKVNRRSEASRQNAARSEASGQNFSNLNVIRRSQAKRSFASKCSAKRSFGSKFLKFEFL
jgi:hypothetical protein